MNTGGYYSGTYSFENDDVGSSPEGWTDYSDPNCRAQIISSLSDHNKVLELYDGSSSGEAEIVNYFNGQTTGTIEYWWRISDAWCTSRLYINDGTKWDNSVCFFVECNHFYYYDTDYHIIASASANTWYHIRIEWDCSDDWHLWINGVSQDGGVGYNFRGNPTAMDRFYIFTRDTTSDYYAYIDAIGYSWDPSYNIGDNYIYEKDYPGTFSFKNDDVGSCPSNWTDYSDPSCTAQIISYLSGHNKVLELYDGSSSGEAEIINYFNEQTTGTIEYWWRTSDVWCTSRLYINDGTKWDNSICFFAECYHFYYYDTDYHIITSVSANTWYHIRIEWDCSDDWHLWINGISQDKGVGYNFRGNPTAMDRFYFFTRDTTSDHYAYIDAIGYSWDPSYNIGDNL
ncbi:MAG: hypothetical protein ACFFAT_22225 [Promethearchaeota archaeon]